MIASGGPRAHEAPGAPVRVGGSLPQRLVQFDRSRGERAAPAVSVAEDEAVQPTLHEFAVDGNHHERHRDSPGSPAARAAGNWTTCWNVGRLTQGMEGTEPTPTSLYWMSSKAGLHLVPSACPEPGSRPPVSLLREHVHALVSPLP